MSSQVPVTPDSQEGAPAGRAHAFLVRSIAGIIYAVLFIGSLLLGVVPTALFTAAMAGLCCYEFYRMVRIDGKVPNEFVGLVAAVLFPLSALVDAVWLTVLNFLMVLLVGLWYVQNPRTRMADVAVTVFGPLYTGYMLSAIVLPREAHCIWLTCSGGPFYGRSPRELESVTRRDALAHPTWNMGAKITIDSATLMNKGLERIEAMHLFGMGLDRINVLIQRESKIHSMVEFVDGSVIAHLGASDMRIPIQYALSYPERWDSPAPRVDFRELGSLSFGAPDMDAFRCLKLAEIAGEMGGTMPCVLNAANEVAVDAFLHDRLGFYDIARVVDACMNAHERLDVVSFEQLADVDAWTRRRAAQAIASLA